MIAAVPGTVSEPGPIGYQFATPLSYAYAGCFADEMRSLVGPGSSQVRWLVVHAGAITHADYTAARVVRELHADLAQQSVGLVFTHVPSDLKPDLDRHGLTAVIGPTAYFRYAARGSFSAMQQSQIERTPSLGPWHFRLAVTEASGANAALLGSQ